jgi:hypothetical protein
VVLSTFKILDMHDNPNIVSDYPVLKKVKSLAHVNAIT